MLLAEFQRLTPLRTFVLIAILKSLGALNPLAVPNFNPIFSVSSFCIFVPVQNLSPSTNFELAA